MFNFAQFGNDLYSGRKSFNFVSRWRLYLSVGGALCLISVILLGTLQLNPGIEFRGGSEFRITGTPDPDVAVGEQVVRDAFPDAEPPRASVIGGNSVRVQTERLDEDQTNELRDDLATAYGVDRSAVTSSFVGPSWGADVTRQALTGLVIFLVLVTILITAYFRTFAMAAAALIALAHDLIISAGIYALTGFEVTPGTVIGFLTILGYSLYDTVVVFDKVRENTAHVMSSTKQTFGEATNLAVNQTLVRSINTSVVAIMPIAAVLFIGAFWLGAGTLRDISLSLFVGTAVGAVSSIFIAPAVYVRIRMREPELKAQEERVLRARAAADAGTEDVEAPAPARGRTAVLTRPAGDGDDDRSRGQRAQPRRVPRRKR